MVHQKLTLNGKGYSTLGLVRSISVEISVDLKIKGTNIICQIQFQTQAIMYMLIVMKPFLHCGRVD